MKPNPGHCPHDLVETAIRVKVRLRNGREPDDSWPAWGRGALRWTRTGCPFDVVQYGRFDDEARPHRL